MTISAEAEGKPLRERPIPELTTELTKIYGQTVLSFAIQDELKLDELDRFVSGDQTPSEEQEVKMRDMAEIAEILEKCRMGSVIQQLMFGQNRSFDGEAPIMLIRNGESERVVKAAAGFGTGYK